MSITVLDGRTVRAGYQAFKAQPDEEGLCPARSKPAAGTITYYKFHNPPETWYKTHAEAKKWCADNGHNLADIPNEEMKKLANNLNEGEKAWIHSWQGDTYEPRYPVLYANGNINTEADGDQKLPFITQHVKD